LDKVRFHRIALAPVKIVTDEDIKKTLNYFSNSRNHLRYRALILFARSSGLRPSEIFQLTLNDLDLENRIVYVRNDSTHHTKTGKSRVSFFDDRAKFALLRYIKFNRGKKLFNESIMMRAFRNAPLRMKDFRKYFSQEWTRRNGNHAVKEILLGHSNNSVDSMHYLALSEEDLKQIYDKVIK
jgi:integrase/recombinase XerD